MWKKDTEGWLNAKSLGASPAADSLRKRIYNLTPGRSSSVAPMLIISAYCAHVGLASTISDVLTDQHGLSVGGNS
ncbi:hypothetical protein [Actinophytocola sp.]|uniref:hypothetical protein n=1 Tax=Actinophytocola sp. TaxID=1872138 RepID=UPI00389B1ADE